MTDAITIPKDFTKVLLVVAGMNLQLWFAAAEVGMMRKKIFNKEFMEKNFG